MVWQRKLHVSQVVMAALAVALVGGLFGSASTALADGPASLAGSVVAYTLNVRSGPGVSYAVIGRLVGGQGVVLIGRDRAASWAQLQYGSGAGWVNARYLQINGDITTLPITDGSTSPAVLWGTIAHASVLNVRSGPGPGFAVVARLVYGQSVGLVGRNLDGSWVQLQAGSSQGWINAAYVQTAGNIMSLPLTTGESAGYLWGLITNVSFLNVRSGPGPAYNAVTVLQNGQQVGLVGRNADGSWVQIQVAGGAGWINAAYVRTAGHIGSLPITWAAPPGGTPAQRTHTVQRGETLFGIARLYGVSVWSLAQANGLYDLNRIYAGQRLVIP